MDDGTPSLEVGFIIDPGESFGSLTQLQALMDSTEARVVAEAAKIEKATGGMVNLGGATASLTAFGNAATRELQTAAREASRVEKSGERLVAQLERQGAAFGRTREEMRRVRAEEAAMAAERAGNADLALRIRAAEQALFDQEYAAARRARQEAAAAAEEAADAAYRAARAADVEAQALREAAHAHQMFEAAARRGLQTLRDQEAAEAAAASEARALAAAADRLRASIDPAFASQQRFDREMGQARTLLRANVISLDEYCAKLRIERTLLDDTSAAHLRGASTAGAHRAAMQGLSFQAQDAFTQISMGASPLAVLAIQGGQAAGQMSSLEGKLGGVARFLIGPWGLAITAGLLVLGSLTKGLFDNEEASKAAEESLKKFKDRQSDIGNFIDETTGKIIEQNRNLVLNAILIREGQVAANNKIISEQRQAALTAAANQQTRNPGYTVSPTSGAPIRIRETDPDVQRAIAEARGNVDKLATSIANLARTTRPDLRGLAVDMSTQAAAAILAQRENDKLSKELRGLGGDTAALAQNTTSLIEKEVALATSSTALGRARAQLALVQQGAAAADKAGGDALVKYRADLTAATKAVQAAEAAQREANEARRDAKKDDRDAERLLDAQRDFSAQTAALREQIDLVRQGMDADEARFRVEQARAGMTEAAIERRIVAEQKLNLEIKAREEFAKRMADTPAAIDLEAAAKRTLAQMPKLFDLDVYDDELRTMADRANETADLMAQSFGRVGAAIGDAIGILGEYGARQEYIARQVQERQITEEMGAKRSADLQMNSLIGLTGAAKGLFNERSKGYKAMEAAEKALTIVQLARTAVDVAGGAAKMFSSLGPFAFPAVAAMLAVMASLGFKGGGGASSYRPPNNTGTGTVLGDSDAQSASIKQSIDQLRDINADMLRYSSQMASSLQNIERALGGVASLIVRTGGLEAATAGVGTGTKASGLVNAAFWSPIPGVGDLGKAIGKALFGTKTSITGNGIYAAQQSLSDILGGGFDASYYAEVEKKKKFLGVTTGKSFSTQFTGADAELEAQFSLVLRSFYDAIGAAAGPLGRNLDDIRGQLGSFMVDLGRIDLKDLTGEEIQEKLSAVFGAAGDRMAAAAFAGLERFQKVGEGYFETVVRVASSVEAMSNRLLLLGRNASLGVSATMSLVEAFGDAATALSATESYFSSFYTDAERTAAQSAQLARVMAGLGYTMPATVAGFRALVEAQDLTTEAGRKAYAELLGLAPVFAETFGTAQDAAEDAASAAEKLRDAWRSVGEGIMEEVARIRGTSSAAGAGGFASLMGQFNAATGASRAGDVAAAKSLPQLSQALLSAAADAATSRQELDRVRAETAASLEATYGLIGRISGQAATPSGSSLLNGPDSGASASANDNLVESLTGAVSDLASQVESLRRENAAGHAANAANTGRMKTILENVTQESGGNALRTEIAA